MYWRAAALSELCGSPYALHLFTGSKRSLKGVRLPNSQDCITNPRRAIEQKSRLISLLKELTVHVDDGGQEKIKELLDSVCL
jgi:hypothetical protein